MQDSGDTSSQSFSLAWLGSQTVESYRYLFAIGGLHAILGAMVWILWELQLINSPIVIHPLIMSGGFLFSFALGFLWTAVPRFTQSRMPTLAELLPLLMSTIATLIAEICMSEQWTLFFLLCSAAISLRFVLVRFHEQRQAPPESFVFVGIALALGTASLLVLLLSTIFTIPLELYLFARSFFLKGLMLFLVIGVGFRLIPAILGVNAPQRMELADSDAVLAELRKKQQGAHVQNAMLIITLLAAFALESFSQVRVSAVLFSAALMWSALRGFHVYRVPAFSNRFALMVWISVVSILLTPLLIIVFPMSAVHIWHLLFIGGLGLMTMMVSIRVSVSHSGVAQPHVEEKRSFIVWMGILIVVAALTRMSVAWLPSTQSSHYIYAASLWIIMICIWFRFFLDYTIQAERKRWSALIAQNKG